MKRNPIAHLCLTAALLGCALFGGCTSANPSGKSSDDISIAPVLQATRPDARLDGLVSDWEPLDEETKIALTKARTAYTEQVQEMYQLPELPSGCEIVSLTIALNAMGFNVDKTYLADNYLYINGDEWGYLASPYDENGGGFPSGIVWTANGFLEDRKSTLAAHDLTGSSFDALCALVDAGYPVLVWTTLELTPPSFDENTENWFVNEHCVVLYGYDGNTVQVSNPLEGLKSEDKELFQEIYEACGGMAVGIW